MYGKVGKIGGEYDIYPGSVGIYTITVQREEDIERERERERDLFDYYYHYDNDDYFYDNGVVCLLMLSFCCANLSGDFMASP